MTPAEVLVSRTIRLTWAFYLIGALYVVGPVLGWVLGGLAMLSLGGGSRAAHDWALAMAAGAPSSSRVKAPPSGEVATIWILAAPPLPPPPPDCRRVLRAGQSFSAASPMAEN